MRYCNNCEYTDNLIYTSMPPQVKCTITGEFHYLSEKCNVEFEPIKHGHWEDCSNGWMCSVCNRDSSRDTDYCPHCGAKMDEEIDDEPIKHGRWIYKKNMGYFCSVCMENGLSPTNADDNCGYSLDGTMNYCWNCGAKMEKGVIMDSNVQRHKECPHRSELGNCLPVGGFCTAVPQKYCELAFQGEYIYTFDDFCGAKIGKE